MSEVNSSENNSIMSETNSSDEISNAHSNSYELPSSSQVKFDDFNRQIDEIGTVSLPVLTSSSSSSISPNTMFSSRVIDPDLNSLLIRKQPKFTPQAPKCAKCEKNVYKAEEIRAANKTYHKLCFKCTSCNKLLEANNLTEHQGDLFCRNCYGRNFGPKGYGYGQGAGILSGDYMSPKSPNGKPITTLKSTFSSIPLNDDLSINYSKNQSASNENQNEIKSEQTSSLRSNHTNMSNSYSNNQSNYQTHTFNPQKRITTTATVFSPALTEKCGRCSKSVYAAEKVAAAGKAYHKLCFSCYECKKLLNSMNCCDNNEGNVFCKPCYGKQYGPKGVGYGIGAGTLQTS